jgi:hypothetical protein
LEGNTKGFHIIALLLLPVGLIPQALGIHEQNRTVSPFSSPTQQENPSQGLRNPLIGLPSTTSPQFTQNQTNNAGGETNLASELSPATSPQTETTSEKTGHGAASNQTVAWQTYQDSQYGFKIQYPTDWRKDEPTSPFPAAQATLIITPDDESTEVQERTFVDRERKQNFRSYNS